MTAEHGEKTRALCPACGRGRLRRSHRRNLLETLRSWFGVHPFRCPECQGRYFRTERKEHADTLKPDKRPEASKRKQRRILREAMLYAFALVAFLAVLYYITREPAP